MRVGNFGIQKQIINLLQSRWGRKAKGRLTAHLPRKQHESSVLHKSQESVSYPLAGF